MPGGAAARGGAVAATLNNIREAEEEKAAQKSGLSGSRFDLNQDGNIDQSEINRSTSNRKVSLTISHVKQLVGEGHKLHNLLRHLDKDGDGIITHEEIEEAATSLLKVGTDRILTMSQIETLENIKKALVTREKTRWGKLFFFLSFQFFVIIMKQCTLSLIIKYADQ